jgi:hypothetical protein
MRSSTFAYRNEPHNQVVVETTLIEYESARTRQTLTMQGQVSARTFSLHESLNMNDQRNYVIPCSREKKPTARSDHVVITPCQNMCCDQAEGRCERKQRCQWIDKAENRKEDKKGRLAAHGKD